MNVIVHSNDGSQWLVNDTEADLMHVAEQLEKKIKLLPVIGPLGSDVSAGFLRVDSIFAVREKVKE